GHGLTLHFQTHGARTTSNGTHGRIEICSCQIRLFDLGNFFQLGTGYLANLLLVRLTRTRRDTCGLLQQEGCRRRLHDKGEGAVTVNGDDDRNGSARLKTLGLCVERLTEFHDVDAVLTQCWADRRTRVCLTSLYLQLDVGIDLLCHDVLLGSKRCWRLRRRELPAGSVIPG